MPALSDTTRALAVEALDHMAQHAYDYAYAQDGVDPAQLEAAAKKALAELRQQSAQPQGDDSVSNGDWLAMMRAIATLADPANEWSEADDGTLLEQFDPWQTLRDVGKSIAQPQGEWLPLEVGERVIVHAFMSTERVIEITGNNGHVQYRDPYEEVDGKFPPDIRFCRRAPVATQTQGEGMDAPDGPGFWGYEGKDGEKWVRELLVWEIVQPNVVRAQWEGWDEPKLIFADGFKQINEGKWYRLHMPWDATPPATVQLAQGVGALTDEEYAAFNLFMFCSGKYGYMVSWLNGDGDEPFEPHFMDVIATWWDKQQRPLAAQGE